jgi:hypothetical protein
VNLATALTFHGRGRGGVRGSIGAAWCEANGARQRRFEVWRRACMTRGEDGGPTGAEG